MRNAGLEETQAGIKIARRNYQSPQICRWHQPYGRKWRGNKEPLDEGKRGEWKSWLKIQHSKTKIMASSHITWWQIDQENVETVSDFIFLGSEINADGDCSHKIKRSLLLGRIAMTNLDSILKNRDILPTKVRIVKAVSFPVVMYGCESCTIKKAEYWRMDAFELWCSRRLLQGDETIQS